MNPELIKGSIASIVRWIIPFLLGWLGIEWGEERIGELSTAVAVVIVMAISIAVSVREKHKLLRQPPPPSSGGDAGASS